jgi:hypothetical protein
MAADSHLQRQDVAFDMYRRAKDAVLSMGFGPELEWQQSVSFEGFSESDFLRESAWVILCSGFRERVIRAKFSCISLCFFDWESADLICTYREKCRNAALSGFGNAGKIDAILRIAATIVGNGFAAFKTSIQSDAIDHLQTLPYIGPVTAFHLAKNLGMAVAKPDRHLQRIVRSTGYEDVQALCADLARWTGDSIQVVDLVLWRFSERGLGSARMGHRDV